MQRMDIADTEIKSFQFLVSFILYIHTLHIGEGKEKGDKESWIDFKPMRFKPILLFTTVIILFHKNGLECSHSKTSKQLHVIILFGDM